MTDIIYPNYLGVPEVDHEALDGYLHSTWEGDVRQITTAAWRLAQGDTLGDRATELLVELIREVCRLRADLTDAEHAIGTQGRWQYDMERRLGTPEQLQSRLREFRDGLAADRAASEQRRAALSESRGPRLLPPAPAQLGRVVARPGDRFRRSPSLLPNRTVWVKVRPGTNRLPIDVHSVRSRK